MAMSLSSSVRHTVMSVTTNGITAREHPVGNELPDEGLHLTSLHSHPSILHVFRPVRLHVGVLHFVIFIDCLDIAYIEIVTAEPPAATYSSSNSGSAIYNY